MTISMMDEKKYFTVSELNQVIQRVIQTGFPDEVWVCGEIQGYDRSRTKKHIFFDLCETNAETKDIAARIGLVIFAGKKFVLQQILEECGNPFVLKDDIEVKFLCRVDFYPPHGSMRLVVEGIDPSYTLGKIAAEKQRLIAVLKKNGTLEKNKQRPLPDVPLRIGLISSYDSAAYNDFLAELSASGFGFQVIYRNTLMQGKAAQEDVCSALQELYDHATHCDVIVITRGGGSIADLSCFDSQRIAEMIARSPVPVISGIGHEIDLTITDLAAYAYQKTPTAVAKFLVSHVQSALEQMDRRVEELLSLSVQHMREEKSSLWQVTSDLQQGIQSLLKNHHYAMIRVQAVLARDPRRVISDSDEHLRRLWDRVQDAAKHVLKGQCDHVEHCGRFIHASDPVRICRRGFSITRTDDGRVIRSIQDVRKKSQIMTQLPDGHIQSTVDGLHKEENDG